MNLVFKLQNYVENAAPLRSMGNSVDLSLEHIAIMRMQIYAKLRLRQSFVVQIYYFIFYLGIILYLFIHLYKIKSLVKL